MVIADHNFDDNDRWIENSYVNNEDVPFEDELPDDRNFEEMAQISQIHDDFLTLISPHPETL